MKFSDIKNKFHFDWKKRYQGVKKSKRYQRLTQFVKARPFTSFFAALGIFLLILIAGSIISSLGKKEVQAETPVKVVRTYAIGKSPSVTLQAQVENKGIIQIVAQAPGIVQEIHVQEGSAVTQGQWLVSLSSNYQGGNAAALQTQLAGVQFKNVKETYGTQKDIISRQRDIATASAQNTEELRKISNDSLNDTRGLLDLNEAMLDSINDQIDAKEQVNPNDPTLAADRSVQAGLQSSVNQLRSSVRSLEYQTDTDNPPTLLASTQKEIALKQLDVQEKALELSKEVSRIQYNLALVQEGIMHPAAPFNGTVERINVQVGQNVSPGTVIATITSNELNSTAVLRAPRDIAQSVSRVEPSIFTIDGKRISVTPSYVSTVATDGQLYSIIYAFPDGIVSKVTNAQYLPVEVPVGYANTSGVIPFVPIDTVYESQNESTVYVVEKEKAVARKITVGQVYGQYVEITDGLKSGDQIILDRNVVAGDKVKVSHQ